MSVTVNIYKKKWRLNRDLYDTILYILVEYLFVK